MKIKFCEQDNSVFAVAAEEIYNGFWCEDLQYAEISQRRNEFIVLWDDDFRHPVTQTSLGEAKKYVLQNYERHTPTIAGKSYEIQD
jgi:hypothetical protein